MQPSLTAVATSIPNSLESYLSERWIAGTGDPTPVLNPCTGDALTHIRKVNDQPHLLQQALQDARKIAGPKMRELTFAERGQRLRQICDQLVTHRDALLSLSMLCGGNTMGDAKFDIDGGLAALKHYANIGKELGDHTSRSLAKSQPLYRGASTLAQTIELPRHGVAIHINAFNFPAWGMLGKAAVAWLAGMPVLCKPSPLAAPLAHRIAELIIESKALPEHAFQLLMAPPGNLLDEVRNQDVVAFTGSAQTAKLIRQHPNIVERQPRLNIEADSLNASILAPGLDPESELFVRAADDFVHELTQKAGQKCTATRRMLVPASQLAAFKELIKVPIAKIAQATGDVRGQNVRMGPLASAQQLQTARCQLKEIQTDATLIIGDPNRDHFATPEGTIDDPADVDEAVARSRGYFLEPLVFEATIEKALNRNAAFHHTEVFGPVATLLPYDDSRVDNLPATLQSIVAASRGNLVCSIYADDEPFVASCVEELGTYTGRMVIINSDSTSDALSAGAVLPTVTHGGPGRAGNGSELGGVLGLSLYSQRTTLQTSESVLSKLSI